MLSIPSRLQTMPPPQGLSNLELIAYLSWSPGTLHESLLHSTYHRLPCFIVIYVCVCLPEETASFQSRGQGLCALCLPSLVSDRMLVSYTFAELTS